MGKNESRTRGRPPRSALAANVGNGQDRSIRKLSDVFKSLSDENRLKIMFLLAERGELNVSTIGEELGQSQPAVSHHLTQLRSAGLIDFRREGKFNYYALQEEGLDNVLSLLFQNGKTKLSLGGVELEFKRNA